ncbi:LacI family DNA-binding transcriptional regulator [Solirubrobacter soli]|uniref:LacI family DNA-binding transcriptional regulator n=1 Tax=Solirubrobacter soli TaxID=363832 RepID=UPI00040B1E39|nr:LacI family DNA-binding transcriptional regulator [Solirubrobacter soli]
MKDVAAVAGVSLSTVSRVVNGHPPVAPELAIKVERAVELLGYRHNHTAGTLRRSNGMSASIALIFEDVSNPFFSGIHRGVEDVARTRGVVTFAGSSDEDPDRELELIEGMLSRRVDGVIIAPTATDHTHLLRDVANGLGLVFVDRPSPTIDADCVLTDNRGATERAIEHLIAHGHERIAFIGYPPIIHTSVERFQGYKAAMHLAGLPEITRHPVDPAGAFADTTELLSGPGAPTALFSSQNLLTIEVLRALHRLGRQHDVAHIGFDDIPLAAAVEPAVTVVAQDALGLGRTAAELLFSRLDGHRGASRRVVLEAPLIERGSGELRPSPL